MADSHQAWGGTRKPRPLANALVFETNKSKNALCALIYINGIDLAQRSSIAQNRAPHSLRD